MSTGVHWLTTCCVALCCAVLCCAVLCCAVLCCAVLCCAVLCCAVLVFFSQVFPHEYRRALAEADTVRKAEEEQKAAIKAAGEGFRFYGLGPRVQGFRDLPKT